MHFVLVVTAAATAVGAAVVSTWSPCGRSMLSTLTPLGSHSRGASYRTTVGWFVSGSAAGGLCLGLVLAGAADVGQAMHMSLGLLTAVGTGAFAVAVVVDSLLGPSRVPGHHRQVNERWLDRYRPWVYGAGFGWQIGAGFATYITTATLYLLVVLAALIGSPMVAIGLGAGFGLVRGLAVLLGRRITGPEALLSFHRRFDLIQGVARTSVIASTAASAVAVGVVGLHQSSAGRSAGAASEAVVAVAAACAVAVAGRAAVVVAASRRRRVRVQPG